MAMWRTNPPELDKSALYNVVTEPGQAVWQGGISKLISFGVLSSQVLPNQRRVVHLHPHKHSNCFYHVLLKQKEYLFGGMTGRVPHLERR